MSEYSSIIVGAVHMMHKLFADMFAIEHMEKGTIGRRGGKRFASFHSFLSSVKTVDKPGWTFYGIAQGQCAPKLLQKIVIHCKFHINPITITTNISFDFILTTQEWEKHSEKYPMNTLKPK